MSIVNMDGAGLSEIQKNSVLDLYANFKAGEFDAFVEEAEERNTNFDESMRKTCRLFSGRYVDPFNLDAATDIDIVDIAHSLSLQCRYNGHVPEFWNVAAHSIVVYQTVKLILDRTGYVQDKSYYRLLMTALLHDASETYTGDMIAPVKQRIPLFNALETLVNTVLKKKFDLWYPFPELITHVDRCVLATEMHQFMYDKDASDYGFVLKLDLKETAKQYGTDVESWFLSIYDWINTGMQSHKDMHVSGV